MNGALLLLGAASLAAVPLSLERAIELALERNAEVVSAALETDASRWSRASALAAVGPKVRVEGAVQGWDKALEASLDIPGVPKGPSLRIREQVTASAQVTVVQPLLSLWPILEGFRIKDLGVDLARLKLLQARRDVTFQATEGFYRVLQAQQLVAVNETSASQVEALATKAAAFERQGLTGSNDVLRAKIASAAAKLRVLQARGNQSLALARLRTLLRLGPDEEVALAAPEPVPPQARPSFELAGARQAALAQRSELVEIEARLGQARAGSRIAWSRLLPQLNGLASYQYSQGQALAQPHQYFAGVSASWDVFESGASWFGAREADLRERQAELGLQRLRDAIGLDAQLAFVTWQTAREALAVSEQAIGQAEENFRIESKRYENAANTTFDVLDAQTLLTQALAQHESARFELLVAQAGLHRATGAFDVKAREQGK